MVRRRGLPTVEEDEAPYVNNGNDEIPPPPPVFHDGVHPTLIQFMGDITRQFTEAIHGCLSPWH
jgi:hypothetical protein